MKALNCPSCGAPVSLKKGIKKYKCFFCENEFYPDYENAPEFNGLSEKEFNKLKKRADDALARGLMEKATAQYSTLCELLKEDYERYNDYMQIKARFHRLKIHDYIIENYSVPNGNTILDIQNRASTADVNNPPEFYYARIDGPMMEIIEEIEDECEVIKELENEKTLGEGTAQAFGVFCYLEINILLSNVIPQACEFIYLNCSYNQEPGWNQYGSWIDNKALAGPVYLGLQIHAEYLGIMMKFLENIDIGDDYSDNSLCAIPLFSDAKELMGGVNLHQIKIDKRHPKSPYTLNAIRDVPSVREFFSSFEKLDKKLEPARKVALEKKRQQEEKAKLEAEQKRIQAEKRRKEYEASPEYAKKKRNQRNGFIALGVVFGLIFITIPLQSYFSDKNKLAKENDVPSSLSGLRKKSRSTKNPIINKDKNIGPEIYKNKVVLARKIMEVCAGPSSGYANPRNKMRPLKRGKSLANCINKSTKYAMGSSNWYQRDVLKSLRGCVDSSFLESLKNVNSSNQVDNILNKCLYKIDYKEYGGNDINRFPLPRLPGKSYIIVF